MPGFLQSLSWLALVLAVVPSAAADSSAVAAKASSRRPADEAELRYWLQTMLWDFRYTPREMAAATGLSAEQVSADLARLNLQPSGRPRRAVDAPLKLRPYPGGRHPRLGFLEGAIDPQRETKFGVFCPWDESSYVVVDVPEAIFSNLGILYLAHTHVPTMWTMRGLKLDPQEWTRRPDGSLHGERRLPNGIRFGACARSDRQAVRMKLWLTNGTSEPLTQLRVQNCVLLRGAPDFAQPTAGNKMFSGRYACCHSPDRQRWIITAWHPLDRTWGNERCPCLHSDPKIPDCRPGQTQRVQGWLSFYQGTDIQGELKRIEGTHWDAPGKEPRAR